MPTAYDVPANLLIDLTAKRLRENFQEIEAPVTMTYAKTGSHREDMPKNADFWYTRCASLLRKVYFHGPIGVPHLREQYGGLSRKGDVGKHKREAGGFSIRRPLEQLEKAGLVKTIDKKGRVVTSKGASLLDGLAGEILKTMAKSSAGPQ